MLRLAARLGRVLAVAVAAAVAVGGLPGTDYATPSLSVYSSRSGLYAGSPITFDTSFSYLPTAGGPYYYLFQFGDTDITGTPQTYSTTQSSSEPVIVKHTYATPGTFIANVTISDSPFAAVSVIQGSGVAVASISVGGYAAAAASVAVVVLAPQSGCYKYELANTVTWNSSCTSADTSACGAIVTIRVADPVNGTPKALSAAFNSIGDVPSMSVSNLTHIYQFPSSKASFDETGWTFNLDQSVFVSSSPLTATVSSQKGNILSCSVATTLIDLTQPVTSTMAFGYDMSQSIVSGSTSTKSALVLKTDAYVPSSIRVVQNTCVQSRLGVVFSRTTQGSMNSLGALFATSRDGFAQSATLWDLTRDNSSLRNNAHSMCGSAGLSTTQCQDLHLFDGVNVDGSLFLATSVGVFVVVDAAFGSYTNTAANYTRVATGVSLVDAPGSAVRKVSLFGRSDCMQSGSGRVFITYPTVTTGKIDGMLYATSISAVSNATMKTLNISYLSTSLPSSGIGATHSFVAAEYDPVRLQNVYLVGIDIASASCIGRGCQYTSAIAVIHNTTAGTMTFSEDITFGTKVTGMHLHSNVDSIYVFGSELWVSHDGGVNWEKLTELSANNTGNEYFVSMASTVDDVYASTFALLTNLGNVYYGTAATAEVVRMSTLPALSSNRALTAIIADGVDGFSVLATNAVPAYGASASMYPSGFLADPTGTLRPSILVRLPLSPASATEVVDEGFGSSIVPVFLSSSRLYFFVASVSTTTVFHQHHLGWQISHTNGGSAIITNVASDGSRVDCTVMTPFVSESVSVSPALSAGVLTISGITSTGDVTTMPLISASSPSTQTVTLTLTTLATGGNGWFVSDIGKTIIALQASIVITGVTSATVAIGTMMQPPNAIAVSGAVTAVRGTWSLYDFRGYMSYTATLSQTIAFSVNGGGLTATLQSGTMAFESKHAGMILKTPTGWGLVQYVMTSSTAFVSPFLTYTSTVYTPSDWSLVRPTLQYVLGATAPTTSQLSRAWRLSPTACSQDILDLSTPANVIYLTKGSNVTITGNLTSTTRQKSPFGPKRIFPMFGNSLNSHQAFTDDICALDTSRAAQFSLKVNDMYIAAQSVFKIRTLPLPSVMCEKPPFAIVRVIYGCPATRKLVYVRPVDDNEFLYGSPKLSGSIPLVTVLPPNYRPPSPLGRLVPTTDNIYNAAPDQPMYNTRFLVSRNTGRYKQCSGVSTRANCKCTDADHLSMSMASTDCIDRVINVIQSTPFDPKLAVTQFGVAQKPFNATIMLQELNGRTDFCPSSVSRQQCIQNASAALASVRFNPLTDTITWSGYELYHFRVTVLPADTNEYCSLSTDFTVFVILPTTAHRLLFVTEITTALAFGAVLFVMYWYKSK